MLGPQYGWRHARRRLPRTENQLPGTEILKRVVNVTGAQNQQTQFHAPSWDNHPFLKSKTRHAGENGSMRRNVSSTGSGPELMVSLAGGSSIR